jgi:protein melted
MRIKFSFKFKFQVCTYVQLLEPCLPQLCEYLGPASTASATMQVFLAMAATRPQVLVDHLQRIKEAAQSHPNTLGLAAQVISSVGKLSKVS